MDLEVDGAELSELNCVSNQVHQDLFYSSLIADKHRNEIWQLRRALLSNFDSLNLSGEFDFI